MSSRSALDGVEQQGAEQLLGRDGGAADAGRQLDEPWRQLAQDRVDHGAQHPQRMIGGNALLIGT